MSSASLWGCELKYVNSTIHVINTGQPPCEAVSWNVKLYEIVRLFHSQPPCEAVSWNVFLRPLNLALYGQPPCEAVSWNFSDANTVESVEVSLLVRLWVEILLNTQGKCRYSVSLLVRLWVEILPAAEFTVRVPSASLWGCELKCWNVCSIHFSTLSASLWGCELKSPWWCWVFLWSCQPPCEAVSWNNMRL